MSYFFHQSIFVLRFKYLSKFRGWFRKAWLTAAGMKIGKGTSLQKLFVTWPNQVVIGCNCVLEPNIYFKYSDIWKADPTIKVGNNVFIGKDCEFNIMVGVTIGDDALIASGCKFIDHDHGIENGMLMREQHGPGEQIKIGNDVWIGCNVVVLKGVEIGAGAIVAAGAIVSRSIMPGEIWAGVPAKKIGERK